MPEPDYIGKIGVVAGDACHYDTGAAQRVYGITHGVKASVLGANWGVAVGKALSGSTTFRVPVGEVRMLGMPVTVYDNVSYDNAPVCAVWGAVTCGAAESVR